MKKLNNIERAVLYQLYKSNRNLDAFTLFKRLKVGFSEFRKSLNTLSKFELLIEEGHRIKLSASGAELISSYGKISSSEELEWREVPARFKTELVSPNKPYVPSKKMLDKRTFNFSKDTVD